MLHCVTIHRSIKQVFWLYVPICFSNELWWLLHLLGKLQSGDRRCNPFIWDSKEAAERLLGFFKALHDTSNKMQTHYAARCTSASNKMQSHFLFSLHLTYDFFCPRTPVVSFTCLCESLGFGRILFHNHWLSFFPAAHLVWRWYHITKEKKT